jgi:ribosomal protein S27AE
MHRLRQGESIMSDEEYMPPPLGEDQMKCPRCGDPVDVNPEDLTWSCNECGYDYKQFDADLEGGADLDQAEINQAWIDEMSGKDDDYEDSETDHD